MNLRFYVGPKLVRAAEMNRNTFLEKVPGAEPRIVERDTAMRGFFVQFQDGSYTWMPFDEFKGVYRSLTAGERYIVNMRNSSRPAV